MTIRAFKFDFAVAVEMRGQLRFNVEGRRAIAYPREKDVPYWKVGCESMTVTVQIAQSSDLNRILAAYKTWSYQAGVGPDDTVWVAERADELIGVVRIVPENNTLVLRGMRVAEQWRRHGIGSQMLRAIAVWLGKRECYCVPYVHLVEFYGQIGFVEMVPTSAPSFLAERLVEYRRRSLNVTIMARRAS